MKPSTKVSLSRSPTPLKDLNWPDLPLQKTVASGGRFVVIFLKIVLSQLVCVNDAGVGGCPVVRSLVLTGVCCITWQIVVLGGSSCIIIRSLSSLISLQEIHLIWISPLRPDFCWAEPDILTRMKGRRCMLRSRSCYWERSQGRKTCSSWSCLSCRSPQNWNMKCLDWRPTVVITLFSSPCIVGISRHFLDITHSEFFIWLYSNVCMCVCTGV